MPFGRDTDFGKLRDNIDRLVVGICSVFCAHKQISAALGTRARVLSPSAVRESGLAFS